MAVLSINPSKYAISADKSSVPNIVLILADDLGYGDVQCYNPDRGKIPTPSIDRLAPQGMRFTDAHSSSGVCSPSRYTLLTGRYHWRTRLQSGIVGVFGEPLIAPDRLTIGGLAKRQGYRTACIGKWHLGWDWPIPKGQERLFRVEGKDDEAPPDAAHLAAWREVFGKPIPGGPTARGFDEYFGTDVPNWPPYCFIENDRTVGIPSAFLPRSLLKNSLASLPGPALEDWKLEPILPTLGDRASEFIGRQAKAGRPFLLYMPLTAPHTPLAVTDEWKGKSGLLPYADFVMETDAVVGRVLDALDKSGVAGNTLVVFTSDNGCAPYIGADQLEAKGHFPSGPLRGYKSDVWEGGHREPFMVRWPGVVKPGTICGQLAQQADLLATFAEIFGVKLPDNAGEDSFSLLPLLRGEDRPVREHAVNASVRGLPAVRQGAWKLILGPGSGGWSKDKGDQPVQLYNLAEDLGETNNLAVRQPERVAQMEGLLERIIADGRSTPGAKQENDMPVRRFAATAAAEEFPVKPYADPAQLDVPWPKHSFYKQPWRGFLETRSAYDFLQGVGVNFNVPGNEALAVRLLSEAGFRTFRIEVGFGSVRWDRKGINGDERFKRVLTLCREYKIRPNLLLNAHQGAPCPVQFFNRTLAEDAPRGSRQVKLTDTRDLVSGRSGLSNLSEYWAAECLVTSLDESTGVCQLSKPLPKDLKAGNVPMATLGYSPLCPVGTKDFDETAAGWIDYALLVCRLARDAGIDEFDVEIWNELSFGTRFLNINNYYDKDTPKTPRGPDFLRPGGNCWELARRTAEAVKRENPEARCIWGFSNTTFYHCPIAELPPGIDGQSYHPYGTGTRSLPKQETHLDRPEFNLERYTPTIDIRMPEGWAHTFIQTEGVMRHLNPKSRAENRPKGVERFRHYMTEHGVVPGECGITDVERGWQVKSLCLTRSLALWLNKGVDVMHYYCAYDRDPLAMGLLPADLPKLPADASFDLAATPPLRTLRNLARRLAESVPLTETRPLAVGLTSLGPQKTIFAGDENHPPLWHRDVAAVLPFQVTARKFAVLVYVMTYDVTRPIEPEEYRLSISGLQGDKAAVELYDPHEDRTIAAGAPTRGVDRLELILPLVDHPRMLMLSE